MADAPLTLKTRMAAVRVAGIAAIMAGAALLQFSSRHEPASGQRAGGSNGALAASAADPPGLSSTPSASSAQEAEPGTVLLEQVRKGEPVERTVRAAVTDQGWSYVAAEIGEEVHLGRLSAAGEVAWVRVFESSARPVVAATPAGDVLLLRRAKLGDDAGTRVPVLSSIDETGREKWSAQVEGVAAYGFDLAVGTQTLLGSFEVMEGHSTRLVWWSLAGEKVREASLEGVRISSIAIDPSGEIGFGGDFVGTLQIAGQRFALGEMDLGVIAGRLNEQGMPRWAVHLGKTGYVSTAVRIDSQGSLVVSTTLQDPDDDLLPNLFVARFDPSGKTVFLRRFRHDVVNGALEVGANGEIVAEGAVTGAVELGNGVVRGWPARFLMALGPDGNVTWATQELPAGCVLARDARGLLPPARTNAAEGGRHCLPGLAVTEARAQNGRVEKNGVQKRTRSVYMRYPIQEGYLETLMDGRIGGKNHREVRCFGWDVLSSGIPDWDSPPLDAMVRLVDAQGAVIDSFDMPASMITLDPIRLHPERDRVTWQVTLKPRVCRSRWQIWYTTLLEVVEGRLKKLQSVDESGRNPVPILLRDGMMAGWRVVPARGGHGRDIVSADSSLGRCRGLDCRPLLTRFAWESGRWVRHGRTTEGEGWFGEHFPEPGQFP